MDDTNHKYKSDFLQNQLNADNIVKLLIDGFFTLYKFKILIFNIFIKGSVTAGGGGVGMFMR